MNAFQALFDLQAERVQSDATKSIEWPLDQLDRLECLVTENRDRLRAALKRDFKTVRFEQDIEWGASRGAIAAAKAHLAEWMRPEPVELPPALRATGHRAEVRHVPYGVGLLIVPFNAPLALLVDPLVAILSAGNTAIIKASEATKATAALFEELFAAYFEPADVTVVRGNRE